MYIGRAREIGGGRARLEGFWRLPLAPGRFPCPISNASRGRFPAATQIRSLPRVVQVVVAGVVL